MKKAISLCLMLLQHLPESEEPNYYDQIADAVLDGGEKK